MKPVRHSISTDAASALLAGVVPGSRLVAMTEGEGSFSNTTCLLSGRRADGPEFRVVARRYATFGDYDRGEKARREYRTLELLSVRGVPVPQLLYLDDEGTYFGSPGIVTRYAEGALVRHPADTRSWARRLAQVLADIHAVPYEPVGELLLDANAEVLWFLDGGVMPEYMAAHPLVPAVWEASRRLASGLRRARLAVGHARGRRNRRGLLPDGSVLVGLPGRSGVSRGLRNGCGQTRGEPGALAARGCGQADVQPRRLEHPRPDPAGALAAFAEDGLERASPT